MSKISRLIYLELRGLPPSVNMMYRNGRGGRYKRPEVEEWQSDVARQMREEWGKLSPYTEEVEVRVQFTVNNRRRWDVDNRLKALLDCFEMGGVIKDDTQISGIIAKRVEGETSQTQIEMSEYTGVSEKSLNNG